MTKKEEKLLIKINERRDYLKNLYNVNDESYLKSCEEDDLELAEYFRNCMNYIRGKIVELDMIKSMIEDNK